MSAIDEAANAIGGALARLADLERDAAAARVAVAASESDAAEAERMAGDIGLRDDGEAASAAAAAADQAHDRLREATRRAAALERAAGTIRQELSAAIAAGRATMEHESEAQLAALDGKYRRAISAAHAAVQEAASTAGAAQHHAFPHLSRVRLPAALLDATALDLTASFDRPAVSAGPFLALRAAIQRAERVAQPEAVA
jgi:hypothetical protein